MNQLITHAMNFKELKIKKLKKFKTDKSEDKLNDNKKSEEKFKDKSDKNDEKNLNLNSTIMLKNSKKNTGKSDTDKNCNYCDSSYHNINRCKLKNSTEQSEE